MTARCIVCSDYYNFRQYNNRKLSDDKCPCGGELEKMTAVKGKYAYKNEAGDEFDFVTLPLPHFVPLNKTV